MSDTYEEWRKRWGGGFLAGEGSQDWQGAHGRLADALVAQWRAATKSAFPELAPSDALPVIGAELGIPRSPFDTDTQYALKLRRAWEVWPFAGTPLGLLLALEAAGYPAGMVTLVQQEAHAFQLGAATLATDQRLVQLSLSGGRWTFSGSPVLWNRFGVLFGDSANLPAGWAAGAVSPPTGATNPTLNEVNGIIRLVNKWRRSAAIFQWVKVVTAGHYWGQIGLNWGAGGLTWGGSTVVTFGPGEY